MNLTIRSREEARISGDKRYFTGIPCNHGHICERLTSSSVCRECGYRTAKIYYQNNAEIVTENALRYEKAHRAERTKKAKERRKREPELTLLVACRQRAKKAGMSYNLEKEDVIIPTYCPVLGIPLIVAEHGKSDNSPSLDRHDNKKGYVKGNVEVISLRANRIKSDATYEELMAIALYAKQRKDN